MARQEGIETPTYSLEGCCSIQLSYWRSISAEHTSATFFQAHQVGAPGFEPGTSCSQSRRDTRLRYAPRASECIRTSRQNQLLTPHELQPTSTNADLPRSCRRAHFTSSSRSARNARARWLTRS